MANEKSSPVVVKIGGSLIDDEDQMTAFWPALRALREDGPVVIVHGGGKQMSAMADRLDHTPRRVQGRRVTTDLDLEIAQWTMGGALNTDLVAQARAHDLTAVGLSGADAALLQVTKRPPWDIDGETVDFGWVGDVTKVDPTVLTTLLDSDMIPVVAPLGIDEDGQLYNVNADTVACAVARGLRARQLIFVTGAGGVRRDAEDAASHLDTCDTDTFQQGVDAEWIEGGMRVKIETALDALDDGVGRAVICAPGDLVEQAAATEVVI
ncbi:MAG: acetylglutamate kinase [Bacteroidetes bacterium SW_9_63_38]|nr:MAG: acetylglutamate kinase [Bacteroidetes bacterium SW_9_63_38]